MLICTRIPTQVMEQTPGGPGRPGSPCGGRHVCMYHNLNQQQFIFTGVPSCPGSQVSPCDSHVWDDDVQSMI